MTIDEAIVQLTALKKKVGGDVKLYRKRDTAYSERTCIDVTEFRVEHLAIKKHGAENRGRKIKRYYDPDYDNQGQLVIGIE